MNEGIRYEDICDRLEHHAAANMEEFDFVEIFPEVSYFTRTHTNEVAHVGDWFKVYANGIYQISAYGNSPAFIVLLIEPILKFEETSTTVA